MPIDAQCKNCGKTYRVQDAMAGKKGKCKECGGVFEVPHGIDLLEVGGPTTLQMAQMTGKRCPKCDVPVMDGQIACDECGAELRFTGRPVRQMRSAQTGPSPLLKTGLILLVVLGLIGAVYFLVVK